MISYSSPEVFLKIIIAGLDSYKDKDLLRRQCSGYPGLIVLYIKGGEKEVKTLVRNLHLVYQAGSLGGTSSVIRALCESCSFFFWMYNAYHEKWFCVLILQAFGRELVVFRGGHWERSDSKPDANLHWTGESQGYHCRSWSGPQGRTFWYLIFVGHISIEHMTSLM